LNYFGAQNTGRFSGSDGVNVQNLPRGGALRQSIIAPEGYVLVVSDFNAIEARVISWLAGEEELLKVFRSGGDPYCSFASTVYGRTITKADKAQRFLGKVSILGLGYSLGWRKFAAILAVGPLGQPPIIFTEHDLCAMNGKIIKDLDTKGITTKLTGDALQIHCSAAKHLVSTYRETYNRIPAYWRTCDKILQAMFRGVKHQFGAISTDKDKVLLPNGLYLQYKGLHADEDDNWRYFGKRGEKQYIYSGKMAENLTQAVARIVMTDAQIEIAKRYRVCLTVHDEIVCCVKEEEGEDALKFMLEVMSQTPRWAEGLPVAAEGGISTTYGGAK
jgi:DNA polymerase